MTMITATWTIDDDANYSNELVEDLAKEIQEELDNEIMIDMLVLGGWTKVELERLKDRYESIDVEIWIDENCTGKHTKLGRTFVFEKKQDAEWFILKWL
jgi:hypothetical protein